MEGRLRANMLWDSIVRYKTERGALGSKTGYPRLLIIGNTGSGAENEAFGISINTHMYKNLTINQHKYQREVARDALQITSSTGEGGET